MCEKKDIPPYLFVINPFTGKHVNVLPMFELLEENYMSNTGSLDNFIKPLQKVQDFMAIEIKLDDMTEVGFFSLGEANYSIVRLRRMFEKMAEPV